MPYQDRQGRLCGFLNIEENDASTNLCRRYFILDEYNGRLVYYMDSLGNLPEAWKSPVGEINMQNISKVSNGDSHKPKLPYSFIITVAGRQYFLQAETEEDKQQWIEAIENASKIIVPERSVKPVDQTEWRAPGVEQHAYITEITGGVVCRRPQPSVGEGDSESNTDDEESRSSSSGRLSPSSSLNSRGLSSFTRDIANSLDQRVSTYSDLNTTKAGYCVKQGAVRKSWKRRYFTLHQVGLSYSKSDQDKQPIRTIPLQDILESRPSTNEAQPNRDNLFEVMTSKRIFYIQCDTPEDMNSWIDAIRAAIKRRRLEERKSMQDPSGGNAIDEELTGGSYPSPIWVKERGSRDAKQAQKKSFILW